MLWADPPAGENGGPVEVRRASRRRRVRLAAVVEVGVLFLGISAGAWRLTATRAGEPALAVLSAAAGSATPEAAVDALLAALGRGDLQATIATLAPGEQAATGAELAAIVSQLVRLGVLAPGTTLGSDGGFRMQFSDVALSSRPLAATLDAVTVDSAIVVESANAASLPLGAVVRSLLGRDLSGPAAERFVIGVSGTTGATPGGSSVRLVAPVTIVAEQAGGSWYVSLGWTLAAAQARAAGTPLAPQAAGAALPNPSASADGAVRQLAADADRFDLAAVIGDLPPGEVGPLQALAGRFLPGSSHALSALASHVEIGVLGMQLSDEPLAEGNLVRIGDLRLSAVIRTSGLPAAMSVGTIRLELDGSCITVRVNGMLPERQCGVGAGSNQLAPLEALLPAGVATSLRRLAASRPDLGIVAVEESGGWYVSPVATMLHTLEAVLAVLQPQDVTAWASFLRDPRALRHLAAGLGQIQSHPASLLAMSLG